MDSIIEGNKTDVKPVPTDTKKLTDGLISILTSAIKLENIQVKKSAMETLLNTDIGKKAVEDLLAVNDPKNFSDGTRENLIAVNFCKEVRKAIQLVKPELQYDKPEYAVNQVIRHQNNVNEQTNQVN